MEMKKKNQNIIVTNKLLKNIKILFDEEKRTWKCQALKNFLVVDHLAELQVVTVTILRDPYLIYRKNGVAKNLNSSARITINAHNADIFAMYSTPFKEAHLAIYH